MDSLAGQFLSFSLKGQGYGVTIGAVREINRYTEITPVPQTPHFVAGVMNLRGKVIPVVNLRQKLGMQESEVTKQTCIIVVETNAGQVGMIVDSVTGVVDLLDTQIEPPPQLGDEGRNSFVMGLGKVENKVIVLLDIVRALGKEALSGMAFVA